MRITFSVIFDYFEKSKSSLSAHTIQFCKGLCFCLNKQHVLISPPTCLPLLSDFLDSVCSEISLISKYHSKSEEMNRVNYQVQYVCTRLLGKCNWERNCLTGEYFYRLETSKLGWFLPSLQTLPSRTEYALYVLLVHITARRRLPSS